GVQIYKAEEKDGKPQWVLQAPRAVLLDYRTGEKVGTHSRDANGPVWEAADGSKVQGKPVASDPGPNPDAVPWLLLEGKAGGEGVFGNVTFIVRAETWAGRPPATPPEKAGVVKEVRYQATY